MKIIYSKEDELNLKKFKCNSRAKFTNKRFGKSTLTGYDILNCIKRFHFRCAYCCVLLKDDWQLDHFYPKSRGGLNDINNICPTCNWCNTMKNALDGWGFINRCKLIAINNLIEVMIPIPKNMRGKQYKRNGFIDEIKNING